MECTEESVNGSANFAKLCCLVVDICRDVLWDILLSYIKPSDLQNHIFLNMKILKLHPEQIYKLRSLPNGSLITNEYFDVSGLYRILRTTCSGLPTPTRGWGQTPLATDLTVADDIERINQLRNRIYGHTTTSQVNEKDFDIYWKDMRRVVGRIDGELDKDNLSKMRNLKKRFLDVETSNSLKAQLESVINFDKEAKELITGLEERVAALEKTVCISKENGNEQGKDDAKEDTESLKEMSTTDNWPDLPREIRVIMLGKTGAGKSSFANTILGIQAFRDCYTVESVTVHAEISSSQRFGKKLVVCDTPGLFDTRFDNAFTRKEVSWCMVLTEPGPHAFIIVVRCDVRFSQEECEVISTLAEHFGDDVYKYAIVVFTHRDQLDMIDVTEDELLGRMPKILKDLLWHVNERYVFVNNRHPYAMNEHIVRKLLDHINSVYESNGSEVYKNRDLLENTLKSKFEYNTRNTDTDKKWWQFWKWFK